MMQRNNNRYWEAEIYRLQGELLLGQASREQRAGSKEQEEARDWRLETSPPSSQASSLKSQVSQAVAQEAESYFLKAVEIARRQQAKSLELRAVTSLSRLWQQQGKQQEAHQMLSEIYNWFTEGFDTKDLQEAKALLQELSH